MDFGERLLRIRKKRKISQEELAEKLDVSRQTVYRWEYGDAKPDIEQLYTLCKLFRVFPEYFIDPEVEPDEGEGSRFVNSRYYVPIDYVPKSMMVLSIILWSVMTVLSFVGLIVALAHIIVAEIYLVLFLIVIFFVMFSVSLIAMIKSIINLKRYSKKYE